MRYKYLLPLLLLVLLVSCKKERQTDAPAHLVPPVQVPVIPPTAVSAVLLKEIIIPSLPSPYYHFEYDTTGKLSFASFASGFFMYNISYNGDKISGMKNNIIVNHDRLQYSYDNAGRVEMISYVDEDDVIFKRMTFNYNGQQLIKSVRERKDTSGFIIEKIMFFSYYADGNLRDITEHYLPVKATGQEEYIAVDLFEQYDDKINKDGFSLLHDEFFEHVVLLPEVQLQKNNPGKQIHFGDADNYQVNYTYTYDVRDVPLTKHGAGLWLSGPHTGQQFSTNSIFSYY